MECATVCFKSKVILLHSIYALNGYLVLLLAALVLEVDDTFLLGGGVFLAGTLASGLLDGLLPASVPEIFQNKLLSCQGLVTHNSFVASKTAKVLRIWIGIFFTKLSFLFFQLLKFSFNWANFLLIELRIFWWFRCHECINSKSIVGHCNWHHISNINNL